MDAWFTKAAEMFPELEDLLTEPGHLSTPMAFCSELYFKLLDAYDERPVNDGRIGRIYEFIGWCLLQPSTDTADTDLPTAASVGFIEDLPLDKRVADDLYRWMSVESFKGMENLFRYHLSNGEFQTFADQFLQKKKQFNPPSRI